MVTKQIGKKGNSFPISLGSGNRLGSAEIFWISVIVYFFTDKIFGLLERSYLITFLARVVDRNGRRKLQNHFKQFHNNYSC